MSYAYNFALNDTYLYAAIQIKNCISKSFFSKQSDNMCLGGGEGRLESTSYLRIARGLRLVLFMAYLRTLLFNIDILISRTPGLSF